MKLPGIAEKELTEFFHTADKKRLLFGPNEDKALFLHGLMLGMRETLVLKDIEIKGITGLWWYEELTGHKGLDILHILSSRTITAEEKQYIVNGHREGVRKVLEVLEEISLT